MMISSCNADSGAAERVRLLASYVPPLICRRLREDPAPPDRPSAESFSAAVLTADISGFTALTESLTRRGAAGAEEVQVILNRCFGLLIDLVHGAGGEVTKFAGDAVLAVWAADGEGLADAARRACRCGLAIQEALGALRSDQGSPLRLRVGIGAGEVLAAVVGGVHGRWLSLEAGAPFDRSAAAMRQAESGGVVVAAEAWSLVQGAARGRPLASNGGYVRLEQVRAPALSRPEGRAPAPPLPAEAEAALRAFVPRVVQARLDAGQMDWLAEFRRVTVMFVNLRDPEAAADLGAVQAATVAMQGCIHRYGGSVNQVVCDDQGAVLVAGWGLALHAHEDDAARAVRAALEQQRELADLGCQASIGLATGVVFAGRRGGPQRQEYAMIGDVVNLAARLMRAAEGHPLCDAATQESARRKVLFEELPAIRVKGKARPVEIYRPVGEARPASAARPPRRLVGREDERRRLLERLEDLARGGLGGVVVLEGEPGIGKSRLLSDLLAGAEGSLVRILTGSGDAIERITSYHAWRAVLGQLLELGDVADPEAQRRRLDPWLGNDPELTALAPLLNPVLPFELPETPLTREMPSQDRAERAQELLLQLFAKAAGESGTLLVFEDAHWLDSVSWSLADAVHRRVPRLLMVLATRPLDEEDTTPECQRLLAASDLRIQLEPLPESDALALACERLGVDALPEPVVRLLRERAGGHPLFTEELLLALQDQGVLQVDSGRCRLAGDPAALKSLYVSDTVQGVVTSRIDGLAPELQFLLKVASVLGHSFEVDALASVHPGLSGRADLPEQLRRLEERDMAHSLPGAGSWLFKHAVIQEVAYGLLPFEQRRRLHRSAGEWYERRYAHDLPAVYPLLAHHWSRTGITDKGIDYLEKAGERAFRSFANREAIRFFAGAQELAAEAGAPESKLRLARWDSRLCEAHLGLGRVPDARQAVESSLAHLGFPVPRSRTGLAAGLLSQGGRQAIHRFLDGRLARRAAERQEHLLTAVDAYLIFCKLCYYGDEWGLLLYGTLRALNLAEAAGPSPQLAQAYVVAANIVGFLRRVSLAKRFGERSRQVAETCEVPLITAFVNVYSGHYEAGIGEWDACDEHLHRALELYERYGDRRLWEETLLNCAYLYMFRGELERSLEAFTRLRESGRQREDPQTTAWGRLGRGRVLVQLGRFREAADEMADLGSEALDRNTRIGLHGNLALAWLRLGETRSAAEQAEEARRLIEEAPPTTYTVCDALSHVAEVHLGLWAGNGGARSARGAAAKSMCQALRSYSRMFPIGVPYALLWDGVLARLSGGAEEARTALRKALDAAVRLRMPCCEAQILRAQGGDGCPNPHPEISESDG